MLIVHGDTAKLKGKQWYMVEIRSERTGESTIKRLGKALPGIFRSDPVEIFVPILHRDLDVFELKTQCYIFARSTSFANLKRLQTITGVLPLVTEGDCNRASKVLPWPDEDVQKIITEAQDAFTKRAAGIVVGSFVRILDGQTRDYCGHVDAIVDGVACVRIDLKTRSVVVETPIRNLVDLSHVPVDQQVFYYGPLIAELVKDLGAEGLHLLLEDLHFNSEESNISKLEELPLEPLDKPASDLPRRHSRQNTVTALVKKLIFEKVTDPLTIARRVMDEIKASKVKPPKNLFIVYCIVKNHLMRYHFKNSDPDLTTYRDVIRKYGKAYKFSARDIAKLDNSNAVPIRTIDVCKDGRSREARLQKKRESQQSPLSITIKDKVLSIAGNKPKDGAVAFTNSAKWLAVGKR